VESDKKVLVGEIPKPPVGRLEAGSEIPMPKGKGNMVFVSCSAPFDFEGKRVRRVAQFVSKDRAYKKRIMAEMNFNGKQFRKWVKDMRRKDAAKTKNNGGNNAK
jgi:hypothetical protein